MNGKYWDRAWSLVDGCTPCSPGCEHCWSASIAHRFRRGVDLGDGRIDLRIGEYTNDDGQFNGKITLNHHRLDIPLKRKKPTVWAIWNDLFHKDVSFDFLTETWLNMALTHRHTYLVLTKRPERMLTFASAWKMEDFPHIWPIVTVCNQPEANEKIPLSLNTPAVHRGVSIEPMLGPISLRWLPGTYAEKRRVYGEYDQLKKIDWVVLGGETGPGARPVHPDWVRSVRDQCQAAGVPFYLKQLDSRRNRILDDREHNDLPWEVKHENR